MSNNVSTLAHYSEWYQNISESRVTNSSIFPISLLIPRKKNYLQSPLSEAYLLLQYQLRFFTYSFEKLSFHELNFL